jgi:flagellar assembly protein FliH
MPILKGQDAQTAARGAIVLDLGDLRRQADRILAEARAKAQYLLADAHQRAKMEGEHALAQAQAQGHAEGLARGLEEGARRGEAKALEAMRERLEQIENAWMTAGQELESRRAEMMRQAKRGVLDLAVAMGRKVVHRVIEVDPTVIEDQLELTLGLVLRPLEVTIRIHPEDAPLVDQIMPRLREQYAHLKHVTIIGDPSVGRGGCVISFGQAKIDASIHTQLERIVRTLLPAGTAVAYVQAQAIETTSSSAESSLDAQAPASDATNDENPPQTP